MRGNAAVHILGGPVVTLWVTGALAVALAGLMAFWELTTSKYPREMFLVCRCPHLYCYSLVYAVAAAAVMALYETLVPHDGPHSPLGANLWYRAIAVGLFTKSFLHLKFFSFPFKSESVPVGIETITNIFIPWFITEIDLGVENRRVDFFGSRIDGVSFEDAKQRISNSIPDYLDQRDRDGFLTSIEKAGSAKRAATLYLRMVGRRRFEQVFPLSHATATTPATVSAPPPVVSTVSPTLAKIATDVAKYVDSAQANIVKVPLKPKEALSGSAAGMTPPSSGDGP